MPPTIPQQSGVQGLLNQFTSIVQQVLAQAFQTTIPIPDNHGNTVALLGNLKTDPRTNLPTGLGSAWGIASKKTGSWVQL